MIGSQYAEEAVARLRLGRPPRGFFFDFDGVLAPIQDDPDAAVPDPDLLEAVYALAAHTRRVAIVSARPVSFLARHIANRRHVTLFGLYGLELRDAGRDPVTDPEARQWVPLVRELVARARAALPEGVRVENKGLSVAVHYREVPQARDAVEAWAQQTAMVTGLARVTGRMVVELRPPGHDKGTVIAEQTARLRSAWYFGDDVSDLEAFAALDRRSARDPAFVGVRVALPNPETGAPLRAAADLVLESRAELRTVLGALCDELSGLGRGSIGP
jgi:trehalose 6-phosphate phosphatase